MQGSAGRMRAGTWEGSNYPRLLKTGRGDWRSFEPSQEVLAPIMALYINPLQSHIITLDRLVRLSAQGRAAVTVQDALERPGRHALLAVPRAWLEADIAAARSAPCSRARCPHEGKPARPRLRSAPAQRERVTAR